MEFMLFNDLKTFLLSRRSLVGSSDARTGPGKPLNQESPPRYSFRLNCMTDVSYGVALLLGTRGGLKEVDTGRPNFEFWLGIELDLGCIFNHPIGDIYYAPYSVIPPRGRS